MKRNNKKGFTIVELVIVIAVIGILAAVLIPTFSGVIDDANASKLLQEARNEYTEYLIDNPSADVDYVKNGTTYFDLSDNWAVEANAPETGSCLDVTGGTHSYDADLSQE